MRCLYIPQYLLLLQEYSGMEIRINIKELVVGSELIELMFGDKTISYDATYEGEEPLSTLIKSVVLLRDRIVENVDYSKCHLTWRSEPGYLNLNFRKDTITDIVTLKTESDTPELDNLEIEFGFEEYKEAVERTVRLWPHKLKGEGHYLAILQKRGTLSSEYLGYCKNAPEKGISEKNFRNIIHLVYKSLHLFLKCLLLLCFILNVFYLI